MKGLRKHHLDFEILETNNPKTIVFMDSSNYFTNPTTPVLQLQRPGHNDLITVNVDFGKVNTFNSHTLGITDILRGDDTVVLEDGVWKAIYRICPYNELYVTKHFVRFEYLNECLFKIYENLDTECCEDKYNSVKKQLMDIYILMESAKGNAYLNKVDKATKDFTLASKKINKLLNNAL